MTVSVDTLIDRSVRNMGDVHPHVKDCAIEMIKQAYDEGIYVQISDGFRSSEEQNRLYAKGRTTSGDIVTNAKAGQSIHNYGYAIDFFLVSSDGQDSLWTVNDDWRRVAEIGKSLGFTWGGDWTSFKDYPHLDFAGSHSWQDFANGWRPDLPDDVSSGHTSSVNNSWTNKKGKWEGQVLEKGDKGNAVKDLQKMLAQNDPPFYPNKDKKDNGIDGYYGDNTIDAVTRFQKYYDLSVDGVAGKETFSQIKENKGGLTMDQYNELKEEIKNLKKQLNNKLDQPSDKNEAGESHKDNVEWAKENDVSDGSNPHNYSTREQVISMIKNQHDQFGYLLPWMYDAIVDQFEYLEPYLNKSERWKKDLKNHNVETNELLGMFVLAMLRKEKMENKEDNQSEK